MDIAPAAELPPASAPARHEIQRVRRETRRRTLTVETVRQLTPKMRRIGFVSPDLADFKSGAPDDHVKLFLPSADGETCMRDYTPRRFDPARRALIIDFALHEAGPATAWALSAKAGDTLDIGGPRGSSIVPDDFDWYLLIGDETALPAIGRRLEELRPGVPVTTVVLVDDAEEIQTIETWADWTPVWVRRDAERGQDDAHLLRQAARRVKTPSGDGFVWIAAEGQVAKTLRAHVLEEREHPPRWLKASGYWVRGDAGVHEKL